MSHLFWLFFWGGLARHIILALDSTLLIVSLGKSYRFMLGSIKQDTASLKDGYLSSYHPEFRGQPP